MVSNVIYFFHQRKSVKNLRALVTHGTTLNSERSNEEEQQMTNFLKDSENK